MVVNKVNSKQRLTQRRMAMMKTTWYLAFSVFITSISTLSNANEKFEAPSYSPPANESSSTNVYWGDTHLHTNLSLDAYSYGNKRLVVMAIRDLAQRRPIVLPKARQ